MRPTAKWKVLDSGKWALELECAIKHANHYFHTCKLKKRSIRDILQAVVSLEDWLQLDLHIGALRHAKHATNPKNNHPRSEHPQGLPL